MEWEPTSCLFPTDVEWPLLVGFRYCNVVE
jgi:hypothetical protein